MSGPHDVNGFGGDVDAPVAAGGDAHDLVGVRGDLDFDGGVVGACRIGDACVEGTGVAEVGFVGDLDVQGVGAVVGRAIGSGEDDLVGADGDLNRAWGDLGLAREQWADGCVDRNAVLRNDDLAFEDVGDSEEAGDAGSCVGCWSTSGAVADLEELLPASMTAMRSADVAGFGEVVGDHEDGQVQVADEAAEFAAEGQGHALVKSGEGFVQEESFGPADEGAGQGGALGLATGDPGGAAVGQVEDAEGSELVVDSLIARGAGKVEDAVGDVFGNGEVGEERVALDDVAEAAVVGRDVEAGCGVEYRAVVDGDAAAVRSEEAGYCFEREGLAGAGLAEEDGDSGADTGAWERAGSCRACG